jgi:alpha 1,3-glucosidase
MQQAIAAKGRRLVNIVDPHIKRDNNYHVHQEATSASHYVKNKKGNDYEGWCWPGSSAYLDFFQQRVRDFWSDLFSLARYKDSTPSLFIWNDMNEPSVFNGPEVTMPKDNLHQLDGRAQRTEHRDVHNQYGMYVHMATAQGLTARGENKQRPFVLTRAFFAGSQRTAAVWTGDNTATWGHLKMAQPMLLSLAVGQIPFSGADVGGFFGDPDAQLLTRWYQAGAYQPFFRGHAHIDTKRREPWLFGEPYTSIIRAALRTRYANLPYLYTQFFLNSQTGMPIMRPLWVEFPEDQGAHGVEDSFMLGPALLVQPVVEPDQVTAVVRLPGRNTIWYDLQSDARLEGQSTTNVLTPLQHIPVFQRGGTIVARRERARRSSTLMAHDPYTLVVALDGNGEATGQLFIDDTNSFAYQRGSFLMLRFTLSADGILRGELSSSPATGSSSPSTALAAAPVAGAFEDRNVLERVVLLGAAERFSQATLLEGTDAQGKTIAAKQPIQVQATNGGKRLILRKPDVRIGSPFAIKLQ